MQTPQSLFTGFVVGVLLCGSYCSWDLSGTRAQAAPQADARLKEASAERLEALRSLVDASTKMFKNGRCEYQDVIESQRKLVAAELEQASNKAERIAILQKSWELTKGFEEFAQERKRAALGSEMHVLRARADRLEAEIALIRAKSE